MIKKLLILSLIALMAVSCTKEKIVEKVVYKEHQNSWQRESGYAFSGSGGIILNSFASDDHLYLSGMEYWGFFDTADHYDGALMNYFDHSVNLKPPITENIFAYSWGHDSYLTIRPTKALAVEFLPNFRLDEYDTAFRHLNYIGNSTEFMAINDDMYSLVPYITSSGPRFYIIRPNYSWWNNILTLDCNTDNAVIRKVIPDVSLHKWPLAYIKSYYNSFFVGLRDNFLRIDTLGNCTKLLDENIVQMVQLSDSLIAVERSLKQTYLSVDKGETWEEFLEFPIYDFTGSNACYHNLEVIDGKIIAYPKCDVAKLYHLYIKDNAFHVDTIPSDGLENTKITSVSEFNNKVYVTTWSGLFYKDLKDFFGNKR